MVITCAFTIYGNLLHDMKDHFGIFLSNEQLINEDVNK